MDCAFLQPPELPAPGARWLKWNYTYLYVPEAICVVRVWQIRQGRRAGDVHPTLPHQLEGNGLPVRPSVFGLLVKMVGSYAVDLGSIPDTSQVRQKSDVEQKLQIFKIWDFFKT